MRSGKSSGMSTNSPAFILSTNFGGTGGTADPMKMLPSCWWVRDAGVWGCCPINDTSLIVLAGGITPSSANKAVGVNEEQGCSEVANPPQGL